MRRVDSAKACAGALLAAASFACSMICPALTGSTVWSRSPCITSVGTKGTCRGVSHAEPGAPSRMAASAADGDAAAPYFNPEWTAHAANRAPYRLASTDAMAPPADISATYTRGVSAGQVVATLPTILATAPAPLNTAGGNQCQQPSGFAGRLCSG